MQYNANTNGAKWRTNDDGGLMSWEEILRRQFLRTTGEPSAAAPAAPADPERKPAPAHHPDAAFLSLHFGPESVADQTRCGQFITAKRIAGFPQIRDLGTYGAKKAAGALSGFRLYDGADFYITANQMKGGSRGAAEIFAYQNIVVDIDAHDDHVTGRQIDTAAELLIGALRRQIGSPDKLTPNTVNRTGRGLQLWWALDALPAQNRSGASLSFLYEKLRERILGEISGTLASVPYASAIFGGVDTTASSNAAGLFRLPGSYNTKSRSWSSCEILHRERLNVSETVGRIERTGAGIRKDGKLHPQKVDQITGSKAWTVKNGSAILRTLGQLRDARRAAGTEKPGAERRNDYLYCLYASLRPTFDEALVLSLVWEFNRSFYKPMSRREFENAISWTKQHNRNGLKRSKIIAQLGITPEEQELLGFFPTGSGRNSSREDVRRAARDHKKTRDELIVDFHGQGFDLPKIARLCGCSERTVRRVLKRDGHELDVQLRAQRILQLLDDGYTPADAADLIGCSPATVYRVRKASGRYQTGEASESTPTDAQKRPQSARSSSDVQTEGSARKSHRTGAGARVKAKTRTAAHRHAPAGSVRVLSFSQNGQKRRYMCLSAEGRRALFRRSGPRRRRKPPDNTS